MKRGRRQNGPVAAVVGAAVTAEAAGAGAEAVVADAEATVVAADAAGIAEIAATAEIAGKRNANSPGQQSAALSGGR